MHHATHPISDKSNVSSHVWLRVYEYISVKGWSHQITVNPHVRMPTPTIINAIFAAGPDIWEYPEWQERTYYEIPPFSSDATPQLTDLTSDQLSAVKALADKLFAHSTTYQKTLSNSRKKSNDDVGGWEAWEIWAKIRVDRWKVVQDVEEILMQGNCHPRQLVNQQDFVSARVI